jgi:hypothetical protein
MFYDTLYASKLPIITGIRTMIGTYILPCHLPKADADALNQVSGAVYTRTLVTHYRVYRKKGRWLSCFTGQKLNDYFTRDDAPLLHAFSKDGAQQAFYRACTATRFCKASFKQLMQKGAEPHLRLLPAAQQCAPAKRDPIALGCMLHLANRLHTIGDREQVSGLDSPMSYEITRSVFDRHLRKTSLLHSRIKYLASTRFCEPAAVNAALFSLEARTPLEQWICHSRQWTARRASAELNVVAHASLLASTDRSG